VALLRKAIREGWVTPLQRRPEIMGELAQRCCDPRCPAELRVRIIRLLIWADCRVRPGAASRNRRC
jgi:hypothetical protein